ncbi:OLC1v1016754C1 [Oldenlandia corymbosa var. corymbosa]|uniref:OLC1v1016754C1 n=1 Tax=Oldenlandia corymbosa var. corymbosa TaxID=529605 RepID=A0AAV1E7U7_OLDCO|nr:OLC1v1016754C1 [Oldenlandia corymbosa var. corymbosa]
MEKSMVIRSIYRAARRRSLSISSSGRGAAPAMGVNHIRHLHLHRSSIASSSPKKLASDFMPTLAMRIWSVRQFSEDVARMPVIKDVEIECAFKDLMATSWDDLPPAVVHDVKKALSKSTDDKASQDALANVFRAAEAVEEFTGILTSLKMAIDDSIGLSGEDVKPMPEEFVKALETIYNRYETYLEAFGPEEVYLKKKVENELGTKMIHLKMRCSGLNKEWGKVTVLGTSGLAGSYVEQRA